MTRDNTRDIRHKDQKNFILFTINYKVLGLIFIGSFAWQIGLYLNADDPNRFDVADVLYLIGPLVIATLGFIVSKRYWGSTIFSRAYLALGFGFLCFFLGELIYIYYEIDPAEDPYPSIADVFYVGFYVLASIHLLMNIRYFNRKFNLSTKIWLVVLPFLIVTGYSYFSYEELMEFNFDYYYGLIFVSGAAATLSFAILGSITFRSSKMGVVWLLLVIGIFLNTFADVWYYYLEIFGHYNNFHPINAIWIAAYMVISYALYKHTKAI